VAWFVTRRWWDKDETEPNRQDAKVAKKEVTGY
jgi:hypothetical protein